MSFYKCPLKIITLFFRLSPWIFCSLTKIKWNDRLVVCLPFDVNGILVKNYIYEKLSDQLFSLLFCALRCCCRYLPACPIAATAAVVVIVVGPLFPLDAYVYLFIVFIHRMLLIWYVFFCSSPWYWFWFWTNGRLKQQPNRKKILWSIMSGLISTK